jgi:tRNA G37 N-methylase TrmD
MSDTIIVKVKNMQPTDFKLHGVPVILREGDNHIKIEHWLVIKEIVKKPISGGFVSLDQNEEFLATDSFQKECFLEFEQYGIPAVKISSQKGELSEGVKHSYALEWLSSKEEFREKSRDEREIENLFIAGKVYKTAKFAIAVSTSALVVAIITVCLTVKFGR